MQPTDEQIIESILNTIDRFDSTLLLELPRWAQNA